LDEEMMEIRRDLININSHQPEYFLDSSRPGSARVTSRKNYRARQLEQQLSLTVTIPSARPTTAPPTREVSCQLPRDLKKESAPASLHSQQSQTSERKVTGTQPTPGQEPGEGAATVSSRWKSNNTRAKLDAVNMLSRSHQRRLENNQDFSASAELDKIKSISKWLSIKKIAEQPKGIPPIALRYIQSRHKDWKFDFNNFLDKEFPPRPKSKAETVVSEEVMEEQKKCFNNMTAARALLKFKKRLYEFRAKTEEERLAEKMWEDLKKVRYLRIPGHPTEPRCYSTMSDLTRPDSGFGDYIR